MSKQWVFRGRVAALALWLPAWLLLLVVINQPHTASLHTALVQAFVPLSLLFLIVQGDVLHRLVRKAEFWITIVSVSLMLVALEVALRNEVFPTSPELERLRVATHPEWWLFLPHHYSNFVMNPEFGTSEGDMINEHGYRGEEITLPKPEGVYRIVAIGGSTTYGTGVARWQDSYPEQLERILREESGDEQVEVINAGQTDYNTWESLTNLQFRVLDLEPDMVIIYHNVNDVQSRLVAPQTYQGDNAGRREIWNYEEQRWASHLVWQFPSQLLHEVVLRTGLARLPNSTQLQLYTTDPCTGVWATEECLGMPLLDVLAANPPIYYERNLRSMIAMAQANGVDVLLLSWAYSDQFGDYASREVYQQGFREHNEIVRALGAELDIYFYDFALDMPMERRYWADGRHLNSEGNRLKADLIAEYITQAGILP